ncbi:MAG: HRDC domain-containing protein [Planctomycetota bacterium]
MNYESITTDGQLGEFCKELASSPWIALDTEFVSEHTYRPELCLIQVSTPQRLAMIDAMVVHDVRPFWQAVVDGSHETIVHAGRGEMEFCLLAVGQLPKNLFDVQLAAGLAGIEYPAGYGTLVAKLLGESSEKQETRTDWRKRPLSKRQLDYAVQDVYYLGLIRDRIHARLEELGRLSWMTEDTTAWCEELCLAMSSERWRRVSGNSGLDQRSLAIVHELWKWRESEAKRRDQPARRVLRDDLIIELAKRQTADVKRIGAVRGLERGDLLRKVNDIAACIQRALALPEEQCPPRTPRDTTPQLSVLGQFLFSALGSVCRQTHMAPNLVGGPNDIRDWIAWRLAGAETLRRLPKLASGWRAEFVGRLFDDLLSGKTSIRIGDPASEFPLILEG